MARSNFGKHWGAPAICSQLPSDLTLMQERGRLNHAADGSHDCVALWKFKLVGGAEWLLSGCQVVGMFATAMRASELTNCRPP